MWCIVNLPNGTQQAVKWDPKANGQECLEKVCKALDIICEMEYFGLEHWTPSQEESRTRQWINLRNRLTCDGGSSGVQLMLALRVKFWVPVHTILQESARNLFYMQARVDLLERRLAALDWAHGAKLAALLCQADGIRFNELALKAKCPIRMRREQEALRQQQDVQCAQLAQKERKDKEHVVLSFKKRRLSKQKSIENIDNSHHSHGHHQQQQQQQNQNTSAAAALVASARAAAATPSSSFAIATTTIGVEVPTTGASLASTSSSVSAASNDAASSLTTLTSQTSTASPAFSPSSASTNSLLQQQQQQLETCLAASPLRIYLDYVVRPGMDPGEEAPLPEDFLRQIAVEHGKLALLKMTQRSAKYWLLQEIQELDGYGEELFCGVTTNENPSRCDIAVGAHGITVCTGDDKNHIPFSAIAAAKSFRRTFKLEYVNDHNDRKELEIKLPRHAIAAGLYRSITERHAFYVCDKVRGVVTNQFTRDLKGTIASMFKEDTELGKRYVFDIQHTCREVHDQARRILHERGIATGAGVGGGGIGGGGVGFEELLQLLPRSTSQGLASGGSACGVGGEPHADGAASCSSSSGRGSGLSVGASCSLAVGKLDLVIREKEEREAAIERCVDTRISEAMTCKICMDRPINTMFNPCCHVMACTQCADRCTNCPNCRVKITSVVKIYLPPELRTSQSCSTSNQGSPHEHSASGSVDAGSGEQVTMPRAGAAPKITA